MFQFLICEPQYLNQELAYLQATFCANGYSKSEFQRAIKPKTPAPETQNSIPPIGKAFLPYIKNTTERIGHILKKHNITTTYKPTRKIKEILRSAKDSRDPLCTAGIYRIPCDCGQVYIGTTERTAKTRVQEHMRHCHLGQPDKSAVAEHSCLNADHNILFDNTQVLANTKHYYSRLHREAIEIFKHKNSFNKKEESMKINKIWTPVLYNAKCKKQPSYHCQANQSIISPDIRMASQTEMRFPSAEQSQCTSSNSDTTHSGAISSEDPVCSRLNEVNVIRSNLQKMSTAAIDETSSEKVISPQWRPFRLEAPYCRNYTGRESLKDYIHIRRT